MIAKQRKTVQGYVLVEVIASLVIFSIGIVSVMRALSVAVQARGVAQDYTIGNFLCQKVMSESQAAESLPEGTEKGNFGKTYPKFNWTRTVKLVKIEPAEPTGKPKEAKHRKVSRKRVRRKELLFNEITVTVSWTRRGARYSVSAETRMPQRPKKKSK